MILANTPNLNYGYFLSSLIIILVISIILITVGHQVKKLKVGEEPSKFIAIFIIFVQWFNGFVKNNIGKHWRYVSPLVMTLGIYIFFANISGLFGLESPTKYTTITLSLSIFSVFIVQSTGIISRNAWGHIKNWFKPMFFMFPLNIMSDLTPMISMTLRLFGNIASGAVLLSLIYELTGYASVVVAIPFHALFDIGFGFIQTVVFVLLTVIFASNKVKDEDFEMTIKGEEIYV